MVKTLPPNSTTEEMAEHLEDMLRLTDVAKEKEEKMKWELV